MSSSREETKLSDYIERLRQSLHALPPAERDDIAAEIHMHVRERLASTPALSVDEVLARLGTPQSLARQYQSSQMLERASRSYSPLLILRATLRGALTGIQGFLVFDIAVMGYALGVGLVLLALAKPFFPDRLGLWMGPDIFQFGFRPDGSPAHELLGDRFVPITLGFGAVFILATTKLLRVIITRFGKLRLRLKPEGSRPALA